jgi:hypothetical protein
LTDAGTQRALRRRPRAPCLPWRLGRRPTLLGRLHFPRSCPPKQRAVLRQTRAPRTAGVHAAACRAQVRARRPCHTAHAAHAMYVAAARSQDLSLCSSRSHERTTARYLRCLELLSEPNQAAAVPHWRPHRAPHCTPAVAGHPS